MGDRKAVHKDPATRGDAAALLAVIVRNHLTAGSSHPFWVTTDDVAQAGLSPTRRDAAMRWLINNELLERDEETEDQLRNVKGMPEEYEYGLVFRLTRQGQTILEAVASDDPP